MKNTQLVLGWPHKASPKLFVTTEEQRQRNLDRNNIHKAITFNGEGHCLTIAPTGAGKGRSIIIPNLLSYSGSVIVIDPKGENFNVTARYRSRVLKQDILLLDPFQEINSVLSDKFRGSLNPFDSLVADPSNAEDEASKFASMLAAGKKGDRDPYWDNAAISLLTGLIYHVGRHPGIARQQRNFSTLYQELTQNQLWSVSWGDGAFAPTLDQITDRLGNNLNLPFTQNHIADKIYLHQGGKGSIHSIAKTYLAQISSENVQHSLTNSSINLEDFIRDEKNGFSIYIVIPPDKLDSHSGLLRLWVSLILSFIMRRRTKVERPTLFLLDECAQLGEMPQLRTAVTLLRGYGLRVWMFFQDLAQLQQLYSDYETLINNCAVFQTFGHTSKAPTDALAKFLSGYKAEDLQNLALRQMIVKLGRRTVKGDLADYLNNRLFEGRFDENPLHGAAVRVKAGR